MGWVGRSTTDPGSTHPTCHSTHQSLPDARACSWPPPPRHSIRFLARTTPRQSTRGSVPGALDALHAGHRRHPRPPCHHLSLQPCPRPLPGQPRHPPSSLATWSCSACACHTSFHSTSPTPVADYSNAHSDRHRLADCPTVIHPTVERRGGDGASHRAGGRGGSAAAVTSRRECKTHLEMTGFFVAYLPTPVQHGPSRHDNQVNISNPGVGEASRPVKFAFRSSIAITRPPRPPRRHPRRLPCLLPPSPRSWAPGRLRCSCRSSRRA